MAELFRRLAGGVEHGGGLGGVDSVPSAELRHERVVLSRAAAARSAMWRSTFSSAVVLIGFGPFEI